jgi:NAD(P)-dependent dehydrogenase (short-subunit alcohol dehydrogenase family)
MGQLDGRTCLVTGSAGSLGAAIARLFHAEGATLVLSDLDESRLAALRAELGPDRVAIIGADVTRRDDARHMVDCALDTFGALDVVVSNAGNFGTVAPIGDYPEDVFDAVYRVHVKGAFLLCQAAAPRMRDGGSIVIMSSVAGTRGDPGVYGYITAKHAQVGLMRCLAKELAPRRIRVNTLHPGPVANGFQAAVESDLGAIIGRDGAAFFNEMIPLGRHAEPAEIARSALYLASDQSSFTTGAMLMADGGMSA